MKKFQEIYQYVQDQNTLPAEVIPNYKVIINRYAITEILHTTDLTILKNINAPSIDVEFVNQQEYEEYFSIMLNFLNRAEYIWYLLLKDEWSDFDETEFESLYRKTWDTYFSEGSWDLVAEKMTELKEAMIQE